MDAREGVAIAIPPTGSETHNWTPRYPDLYSRSEVIRQTGPYDSATTPPIAQWSPALSSETIADVEEAALAIRTFDLHSQAVLGSTDPALAPMSAILLRTESASSSQIEHLTTSAKQLALAEIDEGKKSHARTVVGNVRAMEAALRLSDSLDATSVLAMHNELLSRQPGLEHEAGRYRRELVWIGNNDTAGPRGASFIAPQHELVPRAVDDVMVFARRTDLPSLVQVAVAHAQFETIHPFVDGNGRTGRALAQAMLRHNKISTHTTVPLSAGLLVDTESYFDALNRYRQGDAGPIVRRFADAARYASVTGRTLVNALADQLRESTEALSGIRSDSAAWRILPRLVGQPVVNIRYLVGTLGSRDVTVARALDVLTTRGVLVERTGFSRNRVWEHRGILTVLDDYAREVRRAR
ncbi:Fic family protein [Agreia sp. Leaf283]|uniref:Fic family protein n=1 Tax=Agreia sp. Leaf283 TaxID=1736321 RepID=UPI0006FA71B7|nr:Fic family protein [Agreia sp. Leaf283]KQP57368.1 cell filamentation protein Fic [Agreia sp. Leaf283]